jgi:hypothetical protein
VIMRESFKGCLNEPIDRDCKYMETESSGMCLALKAVVGREDHLKQNM